MVREKIDFKILQYEKEQGTLIPLLQKAQEKDKFISEEAIQKINEETGIPVSQIYGVATFYAQFRFTPVGKYLIRVCHGTACHVNQAKAITQAITMELNIEDGETTEDKLFTLEKVSCLGCCSLAPVIMINDETYGNLTTKEVRKILKKYKNGEMP